MQQLPVSRCNTVGFRLALTLALMLILWLSLAPPSGHSPPIPHFDKLLHAGAFLFLAFLVDASWPEGRFGWRKGVALAGYGLLIEIGQYVGGLRTFELLDLAADIGGILLYLALTPFIVLVMKRLGMTTA